MTYPYALPSGLMTGWGTLGATPGMELIAPPMQMQPLSGLSMVPGSASMPKDISVGGASILDRMKGWGQGQGLGMNLPTANLALSGLQTIGNLWAASQANKLARDQFNYTKDITETNIGNSIRSYNTSLKDRITSRAVAQGMSDADRDRYIAENSARRGG